MTEPGPLGSASSSSDPPRGLCLTVAYDGTEFHGFQAQAGLRCVQSELAAAAARVCAHPVEVRGASRTDAGVHAEGQVVALDTTRRLTPRRWVEALNRYLPKDISVRNARLCPAGYAPRFRARGKRYRYLFHLAVVRNPLLRHRAWHLGRLVRFDYADRTEVQGAQHALSLPAMREAASIFEGTHDFGAFRASADSREDTVRTMDRVVLLERYGGHPDLLALEVEGTAFMQNMVRIMAGTVIAAGQGRISPDRLRSLLLPNASRTHAGQTAPPEGLTLVYVHVDPDG